MEEISIDRSGNFSCPVSAGVIFAAKYQGPEDKSRAFEHAAHRFVVFLVDLQILLLSMLHIELIKEIWGYLHLPDN